MTRTAKPNPDAAGAGDKQNCNAHILPVATPRP
jgi:hypothetical protein